MSSAELQSLMSQLQVQRQDPHYQSNLHPDHFDRNWTYPDGTPGDDGIEAAATDKPPGQLRISKWEDGVVMDKKRNKVFQYFKEAVRGIDGSIRYDDKECGNVENMAKIIAWEVFHRDKAERKLEKMEKKLDHVKAKVATQVTKHPMKNDGSHAELVTKLLDYLQGGKSQLPSMHKNKKKPKTRKPNPSVEKQRERFEKGQERKRKSFSKKGKDFTPSTFEPRTEGGFGKD
jgi:hypothetical protein